MKNEYKNVGKTRDMYNERKDEITRQKHANLQETLRKAQEARQRKAEENLLQTNDILFWGLWRSVEQVDTMLNTMNDKEKLEALKSQIRFRKNILLQSTDDKKIFNFSKTVNKKRKELSLKEMSDNVKKL